MTALAGIAEAAACHVGTDALESEKPADPQHRDARIARVSSSLGPHGDSACSVSDELQASKRRGASKRKCGQTSSWLLPSNGSSHVASIRPAAG